MFPAKNNFRSAYPSLTCRFCPHDEETQEHLLQECPGMHLDETTKVKKEDFFPQKFEYPKIWQTAANIEKVLEDTFINNGGKMAKFLKITVPCFKILS